MDVSKSVNKRKIEITNESLPHKVAKQNGDVIWNIVKGIAHFQLSDVLDYKKVRYLPDPALGHLPCPELGRLPYPDLFIGTKMNDEGIFTEYRPLNNYHCITVRIITRKSFRKRVKFMPGHQLYFDDTPQEESSLITVYKMKRVLHVDMPPNRRLLEWSDSKLSYENKSSFVAVKYVLVCAYKPAFTNQKWSECFAAPLDCGSTKLSHPIFCYHPDQWDTLCLTNPTKSFMLRLDESLRNLLFPTICLEGVNLYELLRTHIGGQVPDNILAKIIIMGFILIDGERQIISEKVVPDAKIFEYGSENHIVYDWSHFFPVPAKWYELDEFEENTTFIAYYTKEILKTIVETKNEPNQWLERRKLSYNTIQEVQVQEIEEVYDEMVESVSHDVFKFCVVFVMRNEAGKLRQEGRFAIALDAGFNQPIFDLFRKVDFHEFRISQLGWIKEVNLALIRPKPHVGAFLNSISLGKENMFKVMGVVTPFPTTIIHLILFYMM